MFKVSFDIFDVSVGRFDRKRSTGPFSMSNPIFRRIMCQLNLIFRRMCLSRSPSSAERVSVDPHLPLDNVSVEPHLPQDVSRSNPNFRRIMCQSNLIFRRTCLSRSPSSAGINWVYDMDTRAPEPAKYTLDDIPS